MKLRIGIIILALLYLTSCDDDADINVQPDLISEIGTLPSEVIYPSNNISNSHKEELGRLLFWDPILSGNKDISCASCHHPEFAYADGIERSLGVDGEGLGPNRINGSLVDRNSPTVINSAYNGIDTDLNYSAEDAPMFWDNRALSLEEQSIQPILSGEEMRGIDIAEAAIMDTVINRLSKIEAYLDLFTAAFGTDEITELKIGQAIASFERGITANNSRFDQYMNGDSEILSNEELQGLERFLDAGCANCHSGPMLSDYELHVLGVPNNGVNDTGANDNYEFRTPTLRNIELTAPYMHNGIFETLEDVVDFYTDIANGRNNALNNNVNLNTIDNDAQDLNIRNGHIDEIVSFLKTLTDEDFDKQIPNSVPSNLQVGGNIN